MATNKTVKAVSPFTYKIGDYVKEKGAPSWINLALVVTDVKIVMTGHSEFEQYYICKNVSNSLLIQKVAEQLELFGSL